MAPSHRFPSALPVCRAQEDPVLLLKCVRSALVRLLEGHTGQPVQRSWVDCPYGEEEITRLQEELLPALDAFLSRIDELDERLLAQQGPLKRCLLVADRSAQERLKVRLW
jgi:hypothetical protein